MHTESGKGPALAMTGRQKGWIAAGAMGLLLVYAWIDGGEEPLHSIAEPVAVPAAPR